MDDNNTSIQPSSGTTREKLTTLVKNRQIMLLLGVSLVLVIVFIILAITSISKFLPGGGKNQPTTSSRGDASSGAIESTDPGTLNKDKQSALVIQLAQKLPHQGTNFSLYYSYSTDSFTLYINPSAKDQGNKEFDQFLKSNGVQSRSWIEDLKITYQNTTPAP